MATDSTELTFVRCPACRSLVPAVSTRCRMCGATLDASLGSESTQPPASGRVRQKTMTTSGPGDLAEQVSRVREEMHEEPEAYESAAEEPMAASASAAEPAGIDPLGGYIDEDAEHQADSAVADIESEEIPEDVDETFTDEVEDEVIPEVEEIQHEAAPEMVEEPEPVAVIPSAEQSLEKAKEVLSTMGAPEPKREEPKPRVVVEQGKGRTKGGLSFGAKGGEPSQRRFDVPKEEPKPKAAAPVVETRKEEPKREEPRKPERREERPKAPVRETRAPREELEEVIETPVRERAPAPTATRREPVKHSEELGRLFGWLVNYSEPNGTSIELREGRFFVTSTPLRPTDLVLDDKTISTPHAMFTIGLDTGIVIQDLKSDRGVFVREREASTYRREYDNAELQHGDWLRFGDLEFLVSIIAHVGVK